MSLTVNGQTVIANQQLTDYSGAVEMTFGNFEIGGSAEAGVAA